jgi:hypothetical protein
VTLGQRVLNKPLRMRLHYGHPDLFDKLAFMQVRHTHALTFYRRLQSCRFTPAPLAVGALG